MADNDWVQPRPIRWFAAAAALFAAFLFLHLPITDFFDGLARTYGFFRYNDATRRVFVGLALSVLAIAWAIGGERRQAVGLATTALIACAVAAGRLLVVVSIEAMHYPQYALMAAILAAGGLPLEAAWIGSTALGGVDEWYQLAFLPRGRPTYFDWNDVVLNAIGAALGCVAVAACSRHVDDRLSPRRAAAAAVVVIVAAALIVAPPAAPFFDTTPGGRRFLKLNASEAAAALVIVWYGVRAFVSASRRQ